MNKLTQISVVACSCLAMLGCMTTQPLSTEPAQLSHELQPNDRVKVVTKDGQTLKFKVQTIDAAGVQGAGQSVAFDNIQSISRESLDTKRTTLVALGAAAVAVAAAAAGGAGGGSGSGY